MMELESPCEVCLSTPRVPITEGFLHVQTCLGISSAITEESSELVSCATHCTLTSILSFSLTVSSLQTRRRIRYVPSATGSRARPAPPHPSVSRKARQYL